MPERGDVVILTPPGESSDYIKRVIGLPGDTIEVREGVVFLNGRAMTRAAAEPPAMIPVDANVPCDHGLRGAVPRDRCATARPIARCPAIRETLPVGPIQYDTIDHGLYARARATITGRSPCPPAASS